MVGSQGNILGSVGVDFVIIVTHPGILPTIVTNKEVVHTLIEGPNHITKTIDIFIYVAVYMLL